MDDNITFLITTKEPSREAARFVQDINAHVARKAHAKRRFVRAKQNLARTNAVAEAVRKNALQYGKTRIAERSEKEAGNEVVHWPVKSTGTVAEAAAFLLQTSDQASRLESTKMLDTWSQRFVPYKSVGSPHSIDPFLKLPMQLSQYDKWLLQFYLEKGRILQRGNTVEQPFCSILEISTVWLEVSAITPLTWLVFAEAVLCFLTGNQPRVSLSQRRVQLHRFMDKEWLDHRVSAKRKAFSLCHMIIMETIVGTESRTSYYLRQLDELIEGIGGVHKLIQSDNEPTLARLVHRYVAGKYLVAEIDFESEDAFQITRSRFFSALEKVSCWRSRTEVTDAEIEENRTILWPMCSYLSRLIDDHLLPVGPAYIRKSAAFAISYALGLSFVEEDWSASQALNYLIQAQNEIVVGNGQVYDVGRDLHPFQPLSGMNNLSSIRERVKGLSQYRSLSYPGWVREGKIAQAQIDGQKIFALLPVHVRAQLVRFVFRAAISVTEPLDPDAELSQGFIDSLDRALTQAWQTHRTEVLDVQSELL